VLQNFWFCSTCFFVALFPTKLALFSKPFIGIYLFAPQKDKCHSNFEKILNAQVYLSFLSTYPHWEQSFRITTFRGEKNLFEKSFFLHTPLSGNFRRNCFCRNDKNNSNFLIAGKLQYSRLNS